jgi:hypothetical protein
MAIVLASIAAARSLLVVADDEGRQLEPSTEASASSF